MSTKALYKAIDYLRLSKDDNDKSESNSIGNQRQLIQDFVKRQPDIRLVDEKVDDGFTGTTFERPGFTEMMELIRAGKANCIIVKDLSRFGRNFVEAGKYLHQIFPFLGVRFIAINDNYDSLKSDYQTNNLYVPIKNLFNDAYSRDVSVKMRSFYDYKKRNAIPTCAFAVYGYQRDEKSKKLLVDDAVAGVVQSIFTAKLMGFSVRQIAERLNAQSVPCPSEYKKSLGLKYKNGQRKKASQKWAEETVRRILRNPVYTGRLELGKTHRPNYKVKRPYKTSEDSWVCYDGAHEAIIEKTEFDAVQRTMENNARRSAAQNVQYILSGMLYCGDCKSLMVRRSVTRCGRQFFYYNCSANRKNKGECSPHNISETEVLNTLLPLIQKHIADVIEIEKMFKYIDSLPEQKGTARMIDRQIKQLEEQLEKNTRFKRLAFEKYSDKVIDQKTYLEYTAVYTKNCEEIEEALEKRREDMKSLATDGASRNEWIRLFKKQRNISALSRPLLLSLVKRIEVDANKTITVEFAYQDQFEMALEYISHYKMKEEIENDKSNGAGDEQSADKHTD